MPYETPPGTALIEVLNNGVAVTNEFLTVSTAAPGVFTAASNGQGQAVALNQDFSLNSGNQPEERGRYVIVYANGQGAQLLNAATQQPATPISGASAPGNPLFVTASNPTVMVGGVAANLAFSGLAPGFVGLWQLNVQVPANAPVGNAVPLVITFGERASSVTTVAVH